MGAFFIVILFFFGIMGGAAFFAIRLAHKTNPNNMVGGSDDQLIRDDYDIQETVEVQKDIVHGKTAQEFLPFERIQDGLIHLGNHRYRLILECDSINYQTYSPDEQDQIEAMYQNFLNALNFPITIFIQTRTIDNSERLAQIHEDIENTLKVMGNIPALQEYCKNYEREVGDLGRSIGNTKQKRKFIIIPFDEAGTLENSNDEEKYSYALKEILKRCEFIQSRLKGLKINSKPLGKKELYKLIYSTFSKESYNDIDKVLDKEVIPSIVTTKEYADIVKKERYSDSIITKTTPEERVDMGLSQASNLIYTEMNNHSLDEKTRHELIEIYKILEQERQKLRK